MLEAIRRAMTFLRQKQVLHKLGVVISVAVIGIACYVLYHMLRGINKDEVIEAIKSTEPRQIAMAALFVAAGYFTLTFYDLFGTRRFVPFDKVRTGTLPVPLGESPLYVVGPTGLKATVRPDPGW